MIGVAFISDRGDKYLPECIASFGPPPGVPMTVIDDRDHHLGMSGAVNAAWEWALNEGCDYLFHIEEDFRLVGDFNVDNAVSLLQAEPGWAQVSLKRQPWTPEEQAAGGYMELRPDDYTDRGDATLHRVCFSLNPCVIPATVLELGWPAGNEAEMTSRLVDLGYWFAVYGAKSDPHRVLHVGSERASGWRL